ncbi:hypothetical protein L4D76_19455 [Photobacterium sagamiensis]|uniref:hypothetical protein n=1 Tax=Photobacterium sagamiensis TaxID=2910241 RepID=UPI003D14E626
MAITLETGFFVETYSMLELIDRIVAINRAWKIAQDDSCSVVSTTIAKRLQYQKSNWQVELIRSFPEKVWLKVDEENSTEKEKLFSVRFGAAVQLSDGSIKQDAEHLPKRIAIELLTEEELAHATTKLKNKEHNHAIN